MEFQTILDTVGKTPLVRLSKISPHPQVVILAKCEFMNPSGSIKDRIVHYIIAEAEKKGVIGPGSTLIEATSGNTGAALAMIGAIRGYRVVLTMPDRVSREKRDALLALGAEVVMRPAGAPPDSPDHYVNTAIAIEEATPNSFRLNQYDNLQNPEIHYRTTGPEIWEQTSGMVDYFVAAGSTGGTVSGTARYLKEKNPSVRVILPDPIGSVYHEYFYTSQITARSRCPHLMEGAGEDRVTKAIDFSVIDEVIQFTDKQAFWMARHLAKTEGILVGGSGGANVWAAVELAKKLQEPATIVTILPDSGVKYLSKCFSDEWMKEKGLF
jgi:cystathionine beta-synthase